MSLINTSNAVRLMEVLKEIMVVSEAENNKQTDADILRARDIIPDSPKHNEVDSAPPPLRAEQKEAKIPRFDLAEEIMAEQRKITAVKRKAPGKKNEAQKSEPQAEPVGYTTIEQPAPTLLEQDRIIAEIVARDIESLCRGDTPGTRG